MKYKIWILGLALITLSGCLDETFPTETASDELVKTSDSALDALVSGSAAFLNAYGVYSDGSGQDWGYPALILLRSTMGEDLPVSNTPYDYFNYPFNTCMYMGHSTYQLIMWTWYYKMILSNNSVIGLVDPSDPGLTAGQRHALGQASVFRAMSYFEMTNLFEYKRTGTDLDNEASALGIWGLTVPLISENTEEEEANNNPRIPFYHMYRFIHNDLSVAEEMLVGYVRPKKNRPDLSVAYGMMARFWLELGSRFRIYPEDLQTQIANENNTELSHLKPLGITSAQDCYRKAAEYARKAINMNYSPITQEQWHHTTTGFNNSDNQAWMWAVNIGSDGIKNNYLNFIGCASAETAYGVSNLRYNAIRCIGRRLFEEIPDSDWRKTTWIAPDDAEKVPDRNKYATLLTDTDFAALPPYTGLKFRPGQGNMNDAKTGSAIDVPMMRIEEMYLIEAEAAGFYQGLNAGKKLLEDFVNTYRYTDGTYICTAMNELTFVKDVHKQKRIEFWCEGVPSMDYKRLELHAVRGYAGTNYLATQRYNSVGDGYAPAWMNVYITDFEFTRNTAIIKNPDPSAVMTKYKWTE